MLPPERIATVGPSPGTRPASSAAMAAAPAPSTTSFARSERAKLVVEGAGAAAMAALLAGRVPGDGPTVAILSGGNIDPTLLIQVMRHGLTLAGRYLVVRTRIADRPGELARLLSLLSGARVNVVS